MQSIRDAVTGPIAQVIVGLGDNIEEFSVHKKLLCDSSTYFKAALTNGFAETHNQKITLDDENPAIFRTFVAWLYEKKLDKKVLPPETKKGAFRNHLLRLYVFADKHCITKLANDVITMLASFWAYRRIDLFDTTWIFSSIPQNDKLYELILDNLVLRLRGECLNRYELSQMSLPKDASIDLIFKVHNLPSGFDFPEAAFMSVCHYHQHDLEDDMDDECVESIKAGNNVYSEDLELEQQEWCWYH